MPQGPVAMPEIKRGPNENEKRIGFIISEEEAKRINLFDYTKNNAPKKHHSGHKESGFWSTTAYEQSPYRTTQSTDFTDKYKERQRASKPLPPYKHWADGKALNAVTSISDKNGGDAVEYVQSINCLFSRRLRLDAPSSPPGAKHYYMDTTNRHDYKMKGFELEKLRPVLQLAAGQLLEKEPVSMRQILAHRANDATFEKSKSDYASTAARHYNRKISSLLINEQHKRSGVQKFMDSNTNDSESSSKTKLPAAIDTTTATATAAKPTVDTDRLFATTRYTCEVIPKLWVNRVGCIKDALGNKQPYPAPTGEKNYDHLRRDAESRLAKIGIDAKSISDRFLLTSAGASFLPSTKRFL